MASDDDAAESDPASSSDVEITGAEPAKMACDSDDEKYTCVVCKGKRNAGMLVCAECGLQAHSECYFKPKSTAEQDSISEGDAWKCASCGGREQFYPAVDSRVSAAQDMMEANNDNGRLTRRDHGSVASGEGMSTRRPFELNCPFSDCCVRLPSVNAVEEHIALCHSDEFHIYSPSVEKYLGQIESLIHYDKRFQSLYSLATTITADEHACESDGSCSVHHCGIDGECILDNATLDGVQILTDMFTSDPYFGSFSIRCAQTRSQLSTSAATTVSPNSAPNNVTMRRVIL